GRVWMPCRYYVKDVMQDLWCCVGFLYGEGERCSAKISLSHQLKVGHPPLAITRPPLSAPPARITTVPVPWSVPSLPLMRAVRPNSVVSETTVSLQARPILLLIVAIASSSAVSRNASVPCATPSLMCVSQPLKASAPTRGPSGFARQVAAAPAV